MHFRTSGISGLTKRTNPHWNNKLDSKKSNSDAKTKHNIIGNTIYNNTIAFKSGLPNIVYSN